MGNEQASGPAAGGREVRVIPIEFQSWKRCHGSSSLTFAFTDEKTEAHKVEMLCPKLYSKLAAELGQECWPPKSQESWELTSHPRETMAKPS